MKRFLLACAPVLAVITFAWQAAAQGGPGSNSAPAITPTPNIPSVASVDHEQAPSQAVIQLTLRPFSFDALKNYRLEIGKKLVQSLTLVEGSTSERPKIAVTVPDLNDLIGSAPGAAVTITFFDERGNRGHAFDQFSVIRSETTPPSKPFGIVSVARQPNRSYYDMRFDDDIPPAWWGHVKISIDDRPVTNIVRILPRIFTYELPPDIPTTGTHEAIVTVNGVRSPPKILDSTYTTDSVAEPTPTETPVSVGSFAPTYLVVPLLGLLVAIASTVVGFYFGRQRPEIAAQTIEIKLNDEMEQLYLPGHLPEPLIAACAAGECVLYAGAGLSAQSGLPTWREFVSGLLEWAHVNSFISREEADSFKAEVDRGQADAVADSIVSRLVSPPEKELLYNHMRRVFLRRSSPSGFHAQLERIQFSAVLTTNFDTLLEGIYTAPPERVYTPKDAESLLTALTKRDFFILKLYGTLGQTDTVMIAPAQYEEAVTNNRVFAQFMQTLFFSRTLLFVGASLEGIEAYLRGISLPRDPARKHYALVAVTDRAWRAKAELLERRYGITVLPYTPQNNFAELDEFLKRLTEAVTPLQSNAVGAASASCLKQVTLENIGPFDNLTLPFEINLEHKWHVFLGDNGVGKSTVLKAIALALCGERAQPYAGRLLKGGTSSGKITLETDKGTSYVTTLTRNESTGEVELSSTTARPLEAEGWLAVGFPPLRTTSWESIPKGPEADIQIKSRPVVDDLLPLVSGDVDPRLDKLKQWIVNLDYLSIKQTKDDENRQQHYSGLVQKMFDIIDSVAERMRLRYKGVGRGNRILVATDDGESIRLESLSQGTISLMSWIGVLIQRLYEVFDQDEDPTKRYALILMDELDAHMHPLWQRKLINHLKDIFPNAQFIATTHSPLVVGGMPAEQVVRFARRRGQAVILPVAPDMTLGYTDQVLTSLLFDLETTLDDTTEKKLEEYRRRRERKDRGGDPEKYEQLKRELMVRVPPPSASYEEKRDEQLEEAQILKELGEQLKKRSPKGGQVLLDRADNLRESLGGGEEDDSR